MKIYQGVVAGKNFDDIIEKLKIQKDFIWYQPAVTRLSTGDNQNGFRQTVKDCLKDIYIDSKGNILLDKKLEAYNDDKKNTSLNFYSFEARFNE